MVNQQEMTTYLAASHIAVVATINRHGHPHLTPNRRYAEVKSRIKTGIESPWGGKTLCLSHSGYTSWRCCILT
jgi:hypothetical protein